MKDIAKEAETVIKSLDMSEDRNNNKKPKITTSQLRKFLAAVSAITNKVAVYKSQHPSAVELPDDLAEEVKFLKVKIAYQIGREKNKWDRHTIEDFISKAKLVERIDSINKDLKKYGEFAKYMEALVAYHKYYGGN